MLANVSDRQRIFTHGIFDPFSAHHFIRSFQAEHILVKLTRPFDIGHRNADKANFLDFHFTVPEVPNPNSQAPGKISIRNESKRDAHELLLFEMMAEKINVSSRASAARISRFMMLLFVKPASTKRKNKRLSFASFRQIFARIKTSFLLRASSASIQLAATEPDARTNCRTSSVLLTVRGNCLTNAPTDCANSNVRSSH